MSEISWLEYERDTASKMLADDFPLTSISCKRLLALIEIAEAAQSCCIVKGENEEEALRAFSDSVAATMDAVQSASKTP